MSAGRRRRSGGMNGADYAALASVVLALLIFAALGLMVWLDG